MGTNYFVETVTCENPCEHCTEVSVKSHLGKASAGWQFLFRADPTWEAGSAFDEWARLALSGKIVDEYGATISFGKLLMLINERQIQSSHYTNSDNRVFIEGAFQFSDEDFS